MSEDKKKLLMIEDDSFLRKLYRDRFKKEGFLFTEAISGEEGVNKIYQELPDVVLLNVLLPVKGGFELLREIKDDSKVKDIPVIILTNLGQEEDIEEGKECGATSYLVKANVKFSDVVEKVKEVLEE